MAMIERRIFDELYNKYNRREFIHPDPLEFLYDYEDIQEREIVGLVASSLSYGRVSHILRSVFLVLQQMQPSPTIFLKTASRDSLLNTYAGFKHRFTTGEELSSLLIGIKCVVDEYGSLFACFSAGLNDGDDTVLPAISNFVEKLKDRDKSSYNSLIPSPVKGSACKRLNLFLRWMVRKDDVDPGGWDMVSARKLIVPLDTHMHRICFALQLTQRKQPNMRTAFDITNAFRTICPEDPVRYDFCLTRLGIRNEGDLNGFLKQCGVLEGKEIGIDTK